MLNFLKNISPTEIIIILVIVVILFGGKFATRLGKMTGESFKEIKNIKKNIKDAVEDEPQKEKKEV